MTELLTPAMEREKVPLRVALTGIMLVRPDLSAFSETPQFAFANKVTPLQHTGRRPWCVVELKQAARWDDALNEIGNNYLVHGMVVDMTAVAPRCRQKVVARLKNDIKETIERLARAGLSSPCLEGLSIMSSDELSIITEGQQHLEVFWAGSILQSLEETFGALRGVEKVSSRV